MTTYDLLLKCRAVLTFLAVGDELLTLEELLARTVYGMEISSDGIIHCLQSLVGLKLVVTSVV